MSSVSGLSLEHRKQARSRSVQAATLAFKRKDELFYTQKARRWDGIRLKKVASRGQIPRFADCSAFVTWCIWNGLWVPYQVRDTVNGARWLSGYTGTMLQHGKLVRDHSNIQWADAAIYGEPGTSGKHTALCVGGGQVISMGSDAGPYKLDINYRDDLMEVRRYI